MLLIDYNRQIKDDTLLPVGRLREGVAQMRRANVIVFTKCPSEVTPIMRRILQKDVRLKPYQSLFFTTLDHGNIEPVFSAPKLEKSFADIGIYALDDISSIILTSFHRKLNKKEIKLEI